ncbi:MAG: D-glucuronyl C5-epimerase family protein, partial [Arachnia sp.]
MRRTVMRTVAAAVGLVLVWSGLSPIPPAAALDVYVTPGTHQLNDRTWRTTCSPYSSTVTRCRTEIIATTIAARGSSFVSTTGWTFNNLTYKESPRGQWSGNPLATPGEHTLDGRSWKTECDTPTTGRNGCRSWIRASVVDVVSTNPARHGWKSMWVFNNMVRFDGAGQPATPPTIQAPTKACVGAPIPSGFDVLANGMPSLPATGQQPAGAFNPQYIGNFIRQVLKDTRSTAAQKKCLATTAAGHLLARSTTRVVDGVTSRWFPFDFDYSANPSVSTLVAPWYSGLAQANILTLSVLLEDISGDPAWRQYGRETFESFMVPASGGGFTSREKGFLWFEEYPTTPGTSVLNGNFEALIAMAYWGKNMNEPRATAMVNETLAELRPLLQASEVDVEAGLL